MSISTKKHDYLSFCCCLVQQANKNEKSLTVLNRSFITTFQPRCHLHNKRFPPRQFNSAARLFLMFVHTQFLQPAIHSALCSSWAHLHWKGWSLPSNTGCCPHSLRSSQGFSSPSSEPMYEKTSTQSWFIPLETQWNLCKTAPALHRPRLGVCRLSTPTFGVLKRHTQNKG